MSSSKKRLLGEGSWVAAGRVMTGLGTLVGVRLLTEFLNPRVYGAVVLMLGLTALGQGLFCRPLVQAAYHFYPDMASSSSVQLLRRTMYKFLFVTTIALVGVVLIAGILYQARLDGSYWVLLALVGCLLVEIPTALESTLLSAARRQRAVAIWEGSNACLKPVMAVLVVASLGPSPLSVLVAYFLVMVVTFVCARAVLSSSEERNVCLPGSEAAGVNLNQQIVSFALPLTPLALVGWLTSASDRYIIGGLEGLGPAGVYSAAYGLTSMPLTMAASIVMQTLRPIYNRAVAQKHEPMAKRTFMIWLLTTISICVPGFLLITVLREWIVGLVLAEQYRVSAPLLPWLAAGFTFLVVAQVFECTLYAFKRTRLVLLGQSIAAALTLIVTVPMITLWGLKGAAIACPIYFAGYLIIMIMLSRRVVRNGARNLGETHAMESIYQRSEDYDRQQAS
jgi:O-antigen/teichoic acid export membrane protein